MAEANKSRARLKAEQAMPQHYYWWNGIDLKPLWEQVERYGGLAKVRIELHPGIDEMGIPDAWFMVVPLEGTKDPGFRPLNFSHTCPPDCGD